MIECVSSFVFKQYINTKSFIHIIIADFCFFLLFLWKLPCSVIDNESASSGAIIWPYNTSEILLSSSIPYLQFNCHSIDLDRFSTKFNSNCDIMLISEHILCKLQDQTWFPYTLWIKIINNLKALISLSLLCIKTKLFYSVSNDNVLQQILIWHSKSEIEENPIVLVYVLSNWKYLLNQKIFFFYPFFSIPPPGEYEISHNFYCFFLFCFSFRYFSS